MRKKHKNLFNENKDNMESLQGFGDFQTRITNSVIKLVHASARLNARNKANYYDVEQAFSFIVPKIDFIKNNFNPNLQLVKSWSATQSNITSFLLDEIPSNEEVHIDTILETVGKSFGLKQWDGAALRRKVYRSLEGITKKVEGRKGYYRLNTNNQ